MRWRRRWRGASRRAASDPDYVIGPIDSGPPAPAAAGRNGRSPGARAASLAQDLVDRAMTGGEHAFESFVRRSDDRRLERIVGSDAGLRVLFSGMTARYQPDAVPGFAGSVLYDLRLADGTAKPWSVDVGPERAVATPAAARTRR